jgi:hypothetical protein
VEIPATEEEGAWITLTGDAGEVEGVHALWLVFEGEGEDLFSLDWLKFQ